MFKRIFNNLPVKVVSLVVAALAWMILISVQSRAGYFPGKVPVSYVNLPANMISVSDTDSVRVKIIADPEIWSKLTLNNFTAKVDLNNLNAGTHSLPIKVTSNNDNVRIVEENPPTVLVTIEEAKTKSVAVTVKTVGQPKTGFDVVSATASPEEVNVTGPASVIAKLDSVVTQVQVSSTNTDDQTIQAKVKALNEQGEDISGISFSPQYVAVNIKYGKSSTVKTVGINVNTAGSLSSGYTLESINVTPSTVAINGTESDLANISGLETKPLDLSTLTASTTLSLPVIIPTSISLVDSIKSVKVSVNIKPVSISRNIVVPIDFNNLPSGLKMSNVSTNSVTVSISGSLDSINNITAKDLQMEIDLTGKAKGNYSYDFNKNTLTGNLDGISIDKVDPNKVTYTLS